MRPIKLSAQVFLELPPVLAHYLEQERNTWIEGNPRLGRLLMRERVGVFQSRELYAIERGVLVSELGEERAKIVCYRMGYEVGRNEAIRHMAEFGDSIRLALQAAMVFRQLEGWGVAREERFEFDLGARSLYREVTLKDSPEVIPDESFSEPRCWFISGFLCGHVGTLLGVRAVTVETACVANGAPACCFVTKLDAEWGEESHWERSALTIPTVGEELARLEESARIGHEEERRARRALEDIQRRLKNELLLEDLIGEEHLMRTLFSRVRLVMPNEVNLLLNGETGVGRETLARAIHFGGPRKGKPFVAIDCKALAGSLFTQEVFGYTRDGVSGALRDYVGACARAHGGTLYLSDVSALSLDAQLRLLRVMHERQVIPMGGNAPFRADVRVIAATDQDLQKAVKKGQFLAPLYDALGVVTLDIPPLRERREDIPLLAARFLGEFSAHYQRSGLVMSDDFCTALLECAWPGNVRQLRRTMEHAVVTATEGVLGLSNLPEDVLAGRFRRSQVGELNEEVIRAALRRTHGNRGEAAELIGVSRTSFWRAMKRLGIS